jgi:hypothetical protein
MAEVFRSMARDGEYPVVAPSRDALGVVFGPPPDGDIEVITSQVYPGTGGLSVAPTWRDLPPGRIPKRLKRLLPEARGSNRFYCWRMGSGDFADETMNQDLKLTVDEPRHGFIGPTRAMTADDFQVAVAATRTMWHRIDEDQ